MAAVAHIETSAYAGWYVQDNASFSALCTAYCKPAWQHIGQNVHARLDTACSIATFNDEELGVPIDDTELPVHIRNRMASACKQASVVSAPGLPASTGSAALPRASLEQVCYF